MSIFRTPARVVAACIATVALLLGCSWPDVRKADAVQRLYVLYCGEAHIPDVSLWSPGVNVGQPAVFSDNCYLIQHGKDWMLWDSGYPDALADTPGGVVGPRSRAVRVKTLSSQLAELGLAPDRITHLAFSHTHGDHVGNANLFAGATLYIQLAEHDAAFGPQPAKYGFVPATYEKLRTTPTVKLNGDFDIFGDGSVLILSTPGHTPGHQSLLVRLQKSGAVILSGDVVHFEENFVNRRVPTFNFNAEQSRQSMEKIAAVLKAERARLWINHDLRQNATIAHAPQFIE
jgi:glyoxylase-like metal-dependent hydrolase (beta-lactamase superfamily II)